MATIAKAAGVSQGAISSLLNDRDYGIRVSEKTRDRVFKVCRELGYLPNDLRAVVRMYPELGEFAVMISRRFAGGLSHPFVARTAAAALDANPEPSRSLTFCYYDEETDYAGTPNAAPHPVAAGTVSKFVFVGGPNASLIQMVTKHGHAVVALGVEVAIAGVHSIVPELSAASQLAIEHLHKLGHRRIAIVSGPFGSADPQIIELNRGVRVACDRLRISIEPHSIVFGDLSPAAGSAAFDTLMARKPEPTAIFCLSDSAAAGVLAAAHLRGKRAPEQLSVIGCGDDPCTPLYSPPLTTVRLPIEEMAALAVRTADEAVRSAPATEPRKTVLPVQLIERTSAVPAKS